MTPFLVFIPILLMVGVVFLVVALIFGAAYRNGRRMDPRSGNLNGSAFGSDSGQSSDFNQSSMLHHHFLHTVGDSNHATNAPATHDATHSSSSDASSSFGGGCDSGGSSAGGCGDSGGGCSGGGDSGGSCGGE
jgi:hypothetical protein